MKKLFFSAALMAIMVSAIGPEVSAQKTAAQQEDNTGFNVGNSVQNRISQAQLRVYSHVYAGYGPYFPFDGLKLTVKEYTFVLVPKHGDAYMEHVKGNKLSGTVKAQMQKARAGDMILLSEVKVQGPTGDMILNGPTLSVY